MIPLTFTEYFKALDKAEQQEVVNELLVMLDAPSKEITDVISENNATDALHCPKCQSTHIRANGKAKGVQRYWCAGCGKHFSEITGKVTWGLKKKEKLGAYLYHMLMGHSIKKCAELTGVAIQTSFNWRHKVLSSFSEAAPESFEGIVESDDIFFLHSAKGSKTLEREPRKRGSKATKRGISDEQVAVVVTCDRKASKELRVATRGRISKKDLEKVLENKLEKAEVLCTDSHRSYTALAKSRKLPHKKFNASKGQRVKDKVYHVQNVNNTVKRLRLWMQPFNGVSTKYLQNYLNWFMVLEKIKHSNQRISRFAFYACAAANAWNSWRTISQSDVF